MILLKLFQFNNKCFKLIKYMLQLFPVENTKIDINYKGKTWKHNLLKHSLKYYYWLV
jgi:hypothetical protein